MSEKTLHPIPKRSDIEVVPGSIKKVGLGKWTFKWKQGSITNTKTINISAKGDSNFEFKWV
ncbi:hypothetical protein N8925_04030 [Candidatus Pelagibacter sp.]|nr:hypothetical protein [Candidatus Pelagibacter sp.]